MNTECHEALLLPAYFSRLQTTLQCVFRSTIESKGNVGSCLTFSSTLQSIYKKSTRGYESVVFALKAQITR